MTTRERTAKKSGDKARSSRQPAANATDSASERRRRIAEAAYYNAERRGFAGNLEVEDWLEAERQIDSGTAGAGTQREASLRSENPGDEAAAAIRQEPEDLIEPERIKQWARKLKVPAARLREAIQRVGPSATDVKRFLGSDSAGRP